MQAYSIQHCVLFLLTLTFTTGKQVPSLGFTSVMVKLNQSAVLSCKQNCSASLKWTVIDKPDFIVAQCNQTVCRSNEGFNISHDQYLKGDLSLTVTVADYSNRGLYTCECDGKDVINTVQLSIETLILSVKLNPGEDLILNLQKPGEKELIYQSKVSTDPYGDQICNVTQQSLQCKAEYEQRVSLHGTNLILKNFKKSDSGVYTIRDRIYKDINLICTVCMKEPPRVHMKRHESVSLPCGRNYSELVEWVLNPEPYKRNVVAWCNQTSCWSKRGYNISHDQYLKGNFSLTITEADFSMRGWYKCTGNGKDINELSVIVETENVSVTLKPDEDLLMDLTKADSVEVMLNDCVIYSNNPNSTQPCESKHTHRVSHHLKLGKVNLTDTGVYTIQDWKSKDILLIYNVSVKEDKSNPKFCFPQVVVEVVVSFVGVLIVGLIIALSVLEYNNRHHKMNGALQSPSTHSSVRYIPTDNDCDGDTPNDNESSTRIQLIDSEDCSLE